MFIDIDLEQFKKAYTIIKEKEIGSPLIPYNPFYPKNNLFLKCENLLPSGSFKIRGATYTLSLLTDEQKKAGVIAYSTGNHAQAVALACKLLGIKARIVMSEDVPAMKVNATKSLGAEVIMGESSSKLKKELAEKLAKEHGYFLIPPYDHIDVITGQGTIGLEIMDKIKPSTVFVPIGGGGLIAGIATAIKKIDPSVKLIGVEPELENDAYLSFKSGKRESLEKPSHTIADAIKIQTLGDLTYPLIKKYVDDVICVSEEQIVEAMKLHAAKTRLIVEPSGALALAGYLAYHGQIQSHKPSVCVVSGGNVALEKFSDFVK